MNLNLFVVFFFFSRNVLGAFFVFAILPLQRESKRCICHLPALVHHLVSKWLSDRLHCKLPSQSVKGPSRKVYRYFWSTALRVLPPPNSEEGSLVPSYPRLREFKWVFTSCMYLYFSKWLYAILATTETLVFPNYYVLFYPLTINCLLHTHHLWPWSWIQPTQRNQKLNMKNQAIALTLLQEQKKSHLK